MANKKRSRKALPKNEYSADNILSLYSQLAEIKKSMEDISALSAQREERLADLEVHVNLLTRLLTTLCVEKFGIRIGVLKRLVRRIEKEAVRDSQILELESWYRISHEPHKKQAAPPVKPKDDPWDKIS